MRCFARLFGSCRCAALLAAAMVVAVIAPCLAQQDPPQYKSEYFQERPGDPPPPYARRLGIGGGQGHPDQTGNLPPPLTYKEIDNPEFWRRERDLVMKKDATRKNLHERGEACWKIREGANRIAETSMKWLQDHDVLVGQYIPHGVVMSESRDIQEYAEVTNRDIRYAMNDGAEVALCQEIADYGVGRINKLMRKYPSDPNWVSETRPELPGCTPDGKPPALTDQQRQGYFFTGCP